MANVDAINETVKKNTVCDPVAFNEVVATVWGQVKERDWRINPVDGSTEG